MLYEDKAVGVKGSLAKILKDIRLWINNEDEKLLEIFNISLEVLRKDNSKYVSSKANSNWSLINNSNFMNADQLKMIDNKSAKLEKRENKYKIFPAHQSKSMKQVKDIKKFSKIKRLNSFNTIPGGKMRKKKLKKRRKT